jgi:hypothetical protein
MRHMMHFPKRGSPPAAKPTGLDRSAGGLPPEGQATGGNVSATTNSRRAASFRSEMTRRRLDADWRCHEVECTSKSPARLRWPD